MAHKKSGGAVSGNRDSEGKRLGVKIYGGQKAMPGNIIIRQKGTKVHPGFGVKMGHDFTIFAVKEGSVQFKRRLGEKTVNVV